MFLVLEMQLGMLRFFSFFCSVEERVFRKESTMDTGMDVGHGYGFVVKDEGKQVLGRSISFVQELYRMFFLLLSEEWLTGGSGHR